MQFTSHGEEGDHHKKVYLDSLVTIQLHYIALHQTPTVPQLFIMNESIF